jgi:hypothetical protein
MSEWQPIETAPTDGTEVLLAIRGVNDGPHWVHIGWYEVHDPFPWRFIDTFDLTPTGCCERAEDDRTPVNGAKAESVTHWMPLPPPPEQSA